MMIAVGLHDVVERHSTGIVYIAFIANAIANADLISIIYPFSMFVYALIEYPYPNSVCRCSRCKIACLRWMLIAR